MNRIEDIGEPDSEIPGGRIGRSLSPGRFVDVDGIRTHVVEAGSGKPVMLLHGFSSCFFTWRYNFRFLSDRFRILAVDLPGFGLSGRPGDFPYTIQGFAAFLKRFCEISALSRFGLVGHSLGGGICLEFSRRYAEMIDRMVLLAPTVPGKTRVSDEILDNLLLYTYHDRRFITAELIRMIKRIGNGPATDWFRREFRDGDTAHSWPEESARITSPCLILWGREDCILPVESAREIKDCCSHATIVTLPHCGHAPHEERSQEVNHMVADFLNGD